jgi:DNA-directed RNA polymerase subunit F
MKLYVIVKKDDEDLYGGMIDGVVSIDKAKNIVLESAKWAKYKKVEKRERDFIKLEHFISRFKIKPDSAKSFIHELTSITDSLEIWVHEKFSELTTD